MLHGFLISLHILVAAILILMVLVQKGKGADIGAAFGAYAGVANGGGVRFARLCVGIDAGYVRTGGNTACDHYTAECGDRGVPARERHA